VLKVNYLNEIDCSIKIFLSGIALYVCRDTFDFLKILYLVLGYFSESLRSIEKKIRGRIVTMLPLQ
jgi:hypothetical protein